MSRPARAAGIGLLAVAVAAAVVGGVTVLTSGDSEDTAAPPATSTPAGPDEPGGDPTSAPPTTSTTTTGTPTEGTETTASDSPSEPGGAEPGDPEGDGPGAEDRQAAAKTVSVRVYNNSKIKGLAHRASDDLRGQGWTVVETSNYSSGIIPETTAYFRPGTGEEAAARVLADTFGMRAEARFDGIADSSPGVIVIVTKDYAGAGSGGKN
ncbi:LytR C-terminal domain-containing protein [Amycolatopsis cihanbeyliensis]|uniref:LytR C-terminal domain-containing protein n=1 Tax=Amycolatopsis cihanbeyliensis TaxID=1128664 RepID=UPI001FE37729|nr:LytR C-terminal domain-containing protein [Amycolatopsis cihanbeyliensis]